MSRDRYTVIDFGQYKIHRGQWGSDRVRNCPHRNLTMDPDTQMVSCNDCGLYYTAWEALVFLMREHERAWDRLRAEKQEIASLEKRRLLRATREVDHAWRSKMVPTCPHCKTPIFPDDGLGRSRVHHSIAERNRRKNDD